MIGPSSFALQAVVSVVCMLSFVSSMLYLYNCVLQSGILSVNAIAMPTLAALGPFQRVSRFQVLGVLLFT